MAYYLVSVPDGNRAFQGDAHTVWDAFPPTVKAQSRTGSSDHPELSVFKIWDGSRSEP